VTAIDVLASLVEKLAGKPVEATDWRDLVRVRDHIDALLNAEANRRQIEPAHEPARVPKLPRARDAGSTPPDEAA